MVFVQIVRDMSSSVWIADSRQWVSDKEEAEK